MLMYMEFWSLVYKIRLNDNMVICVRHVLIDCFCRHNLLRWWASEFVVELKRRDRSE